MHCPSNSWSGDGSGTLTNCSCNTGFAGTDNVICSPCGDHHYKNFSGNSPCLLCPPKAHTGGLIGQTHCLCYPQAYGSDTLPLVCHSCPVGAICLEDTSCALRNSVPVAENTFQFFCPGGRRIIGNWTRNISTGEYELTSCPTDYQLLSSLETGSAQKQECAPGIWTKTSCPYGHEVSTMATGREPFKKCAECDRGRECINPPCGASSCTDCAPGFYKDTVGTYACLKCPVNTYREGIHITGCGCEPGLYGSYGSCSICPAQYYCPGSGKLLPCPAGGNSSTGSTHLTNCSCSAGYYLSIPADHEWEQTRQNVFMDFYNMSVGGEAGGWTCTSQCVDVKCEACGVARFSAGGTTACELCPPSSTTLSPVSVSLQQCLCSGGYYRQETECDACPEHMDSPVGSTDITNCSCIPGYTGSDGISCEACRVGEYKSNDGSASCQLCEEGKYSDQPAVTACLTCPLHTSSIRGQSHVNDCSCIPGYTGSGGLAGCQECDQGKYKDSAGSTECIPCPAGAYSNQRGNDNVSHCLSCPPSMSSAEGSISMTACRCNVGYTGANGDKCFSCVPGKYKDIPGTSNCIVCDLGKFTDLNASTTCIFCALGKYSGQLGSTSDACIGCPAGKYSDIEGATTEDNCASCATGTFSDTISANSSVTCRLCPFGTYAQNDATTTCSECPAGKYGVVEGARSAGITFLLVTVSLMLSTWCNHESERT